MRDAATAVLGAALLVAALWLWVGPVLWTSRGGGWWEPTLAGGGLAVLLIGLWVERTGRRRGVTVALLTLALAAWFLGSGRLIPSALAGERVLPWNQFHYYLGSKYLPEVGWFGLYRSVLAADDAWLAAGGDPDRGYAAADRARDMLTDHLAPRADIVARHDPTAWTPERFAQLGEDSRWLQAHMRPDQVGRVIKDLGYNPAPPWTILGRVGGAVPLGSPLYGLICASDALALIAVALALGWAFGPRPAAVAVLWLMTVPLNHARLVGAFSNYDWLVALVVGVAAWHRGRPALSAVGWAWAAMTRVFPGVLALPLLWAAVRGDRAAKRFAVVFVVVCGLLFVGSHGTGRGLQTWPEWVEKIQIHNAHHPATSSQRVGLGKLVRHQPREGEFFRSPRKTNAALAEAIPRRKAAAWLLFAPLLWLGLRRRSAIERSVGLLAAVWLLTVSSRYYASAWVLLLLLPALSPKGRDGPARAAQLIVMAQSALFMAPGNSTAVYLVLNYVALVGFAALLAAWAWQDRSVAPADRGR